MRPEFPVNRLIFALDVSSRSDAEALVFALRPSVRFFKVGLELFISEGPDLVRWLVGEGLHVFLDLKILDIPETMRRSVTEASKLGARFITIHDPGAGAVAAGEGKKESQLKILCVTLLTSVNEEDLKKTVGMTGESQFKNLDEYVIWRARTALANGCDGLICSGENVKELRLVVGEVPLLICPGIRVGDNQLNDQKRVATPYHAIRNGADYLVVGRPIRDANDPLQQAKYILGEIDRGFHSRSSQVGLLK